MAGTDRIVVGVDYGTTFTGVAFVYKKAEDIEVLKTWPGSNGITADKCPSEFVYTALSAPTTLDEVFQRSRDIRFGYQLRPEEARIKCLKLLLDRNQKIPSFTSVDDITSMLQAADRSVVDSVADYLSKVKDHTMSTLRSRYGDAFINPTKIQFIMTVPAVWSDAAKDATLSAAAKAGMGESTRLISEPEAAAVHCLKVIQPNHLIIGDNIVICDAGGGTVDLITYRITKLDPLAVEESVVGTGGMCGSVFLNFAFERLVEARLGKTDFDKMKLKPRIWQPALRHFDEYVKRQYSEYGDLQEFNIPFTGLPDNPDAGIEDGYMVLESGEIKRLFDPVIQPIIKLVEDQVAQVNARGEKISAILLVGGFGQSAYLHERLKARFAPAPDSMPTFSQLRISDIARSSGSTVAQSGVAVLQPLNAWTAIVRGAVLRGLEGPIVSSRRCRYHYGIMISKPYDVIKHSKDQMFWDDHDEVYMASDCMEWYLHKGDIVKEETNISFPLCTSRDAGKFGRTNITHIKYCEAEVAPENMAPSVQHLCCMTTDLSSIPRKAWSKHTNSQGVVYFELNYTIDLQIGSATMTWTLRHNGKSYGKITAAFDHSSIG